MPPTPAEVDACARDALDALLDLSSAMQQEDASPREALGALRRRLEQLLRCQGLGLPAVQARHMVELSATEAAEVAVGRSAKAVWRIANGASQVQHDAKVLALELARLESVVNRLDGSGAAR